ncbi:hypothetical protein [Streptomyces beigongshangae]|uniref:hypothetical protein n=1 Tax=Streptomyces beigongshangae TaxID=2841597 RepID=UPI001C847323|nr:hypothetical protein [Streptomyces sp. REN17]
MTSGRRTLTALHLLLVWAAMAAAVPMLGFGLLAAAWGGGAASLLFVALGVPLTVGLLATAGIPAQTVVPSCGSARQRLGWAVLVFVLGTLGVGAGLAAYGADVDLGSASARIALTGAPYAVAAAFFVPSRWVRLGAVAVLAAGLVYGGFVGPAQSQQRRHEAEMAKYRQHPELLYLGTAPPGLQVSRARVGPAFFGVDYRTAHDDEKFAYVGLTVRPPLTPKLRCPEVGYEGETCTVEARGDMRRIRDLPRGGRDVTLVRRYRNAEVEVVSQTLDEIGLRRLMDTLHPLTDTELEKLMREKKIDYQF